MDGRRFWLAVVLSGCAAKHARFEAGRPQLRGAVAPAEGALVSALDEQVAAHRRSISGCFDQLGERLGTDRPLAVDVTVAVGTGGVMLVGARPAGTDTAVDLEFRDCFVQVLSDWRVDGAGEVTLPLRVVPQSASARLVPRVSAPLLFHPEE
jgi:hypothetical protein